MTFYLLAFAVALAIFGIIRSPSARERLQLQSIYNRSSEIIRKQLRVYRQHLLQFLGLNGTDIDTYEIADEVDDEILIEEIERSNSIEEIQGIRLRSNISDNRISSEAGAAAFTGVESERIGRQEPEDGDKVLEAITASLRRLSSAASSGKINVAQLYDILRQETLLHDQAMSKKSRPASTADPAPSAPKEEELQRPPDASGQKVRMYFGQSPLEYTPHQK